mgnify:CR=1 FL=1
MTGKAAKASNLVVTQVKSKIGCVEKQLASLKGLGLGKIGRKSVLPDNSCTRGMIRRVSHLVKVEAE